MSASLAPEEVAGLAAKLRKPVGDSWTPDPTYDLRQDAASALTSLQAKIEALEAEKARLRDRAFEVVAQWHDKQARLCLDVSKDDPRLNAEDRRRAFDAHRHHAASAASIRLKFINERRAALKESALSAALPLTASPADPTSDTEQAAYWKGAYDRMAARNIDLDRALQEIFDRHIPDQPASADGSDYVWAVRQYRELRSMAGRAINAASAEPAPATGGKAE